MYLCLYYLELKKDEASYSTFAHGPIFAMNRHCTCVVMRVVVLLRCFNVTVGLVKIVCVFRVLRTETLDGATSSGGRETPDRRQRNGYSQRITAINITCDVFRHVVGRRMCAVK